MDKDWYYLLLSLLFLTVFGVGYYYNRWYMELIGLIMFGYYGGKMMGYVESTDKI